MRMMRRRRCYGDDKSRHPQAAINNSQNPRRTPIGRPDAAYGRRVGSETGSCSEQRQWRRAADCLCRGSKVDGVPCAPRSKSFARAYLLSNAISNILQPALERLSEEVSESCSAAVLDGTNIMMIAHASPKRIIPVSAQIGFRLPAVATSLGRVLIAALDDRQLNQFLSRTHPQKVTKFTTVEKSELRKVILRVREPVPLRVRPFDRDASFANPHHLGEIPGGRI